MLNSAGVNIKDTTEPKANNKPFLLQFKISNLEGSNIQSVKDN